MALKGEETCIHIVISPLVVKGLKELESLGSQHIDLAKLKSGAPHFCVGTAKKNADCPNAPHNFPPRWHSPPPCWVALGLPYPFPSPEPVQTEVCTQTLKSKFLTPIGYQICLAMVLHSAQRSSAKNCVSSGRIKIQSTERITAV